MSLDRHATVIARIALAATLLAAGPANANFQRSFVATYGVDNPACSVALPCRTFAAAVLATWAGGEVIVLDSGGYGPVDIKRSIAIVAPPGVYAGITVFGGFAGITISGSAPRVSLRGVTISNELGGMVGVMYSATAGFLELERMRISGFGNAGVSIQAAGSGATVRTTDLVVVGNGMGLELNGGTDPTAILHVALERVEASGNTYGISAFGSVDLVVANSRFTGNRQAVYARNLGSAMLLTVDRCAIASNLSGVKLDGSGGSVLAAIVNSVIANSVDPDLGAGLEVGSNATARLTSTTITQNRIGIQINGNGVVQSQGNNFIHGNTTDGPAPSIVGGR